jgi:multimeric flavodoxin WrbA
MNIVTLLGSPRRNGNTAVLADMFNRTATKAGAVVNTYYLNQMDIGGLHSGEQDNETDY